MKISKIQNNAVIHPSIVRNIEYLTLKQFPTGETYTRKVYSGAGATPSIDPDPISKGLIYKEPLPVGGT